MDVSPVAHGTDRGRTNRDGDEGRSGTVFFGTGMETFPSPSPSPETWRRRWIERRRCAARSSRWSRAAGGPWRPGATPRGVRNGHGGGRESRVLQEARRIRSHASRVLLRLRGMVSMTRRPGGGPRVYDIRSLRRDGETIPKEPAAICAELRPIECSRRRWTARDWRFGDREGSRSVGRVCGAQWGIVVKSHKLSVFFHPFSRSAIPARCDVKTHQYVQSLAANVSIFVVVVSLACERAEFTGAGRTRGR